MASLRIASSLTVMLSRLRLVGELIGRGMPGSGPVIYQCTIMPQCARRWRFRSWRIDISGSSGRSAGEAAHWRCGRDDRIDPTEDWKAATESEAAAYEWDAFALGESRPDWLVKAVAPADDDTMLDLVASSNG
jgi:hypothetical protein